MSSTITYKGETLATAENNTKVLKTAGKYLEDDVTITDVTQGGGSYVTQDANGYIILPPDGSGAPVPGDDWEWYGTNCELVDSIFTTVALEDTAFATWTPSTTSTTIWTHSYTTQSLPSGYKYLTAFRFIFNPVYQTGTTVLSGATKIISIRYSLLYNAPVTVAQWESGTNFGTATVSREVGGTFYKNSSGVDSYSGYARGITVVSDPATTNIRVNAQANTTYFTTDMLSALDQAESTFTIDGRLYRIPDANNDMQTMTNDAVDIYRNGLTNQ